MHEFAYVSALDLAAAIRSKQVSPVEVVSAALTRLEALEPILNAFVTVTAEAALEAARRAERAVVAGEELGPLHGLPISIKDLIAVKDVRLTFGSRTMADNVATEDAPAVERVRAAGGIILGKSTTTEFGCKGSGDSPLTGTTRNPWRLDRTPGGSSAGAAASVAAGVTPFALGTDGGGSIRIPSSFSGLFGIKGQFGRVPVYPTSATPTLGHVGPLARTVRDAALLLGAIAGFDARDPAAVAESVPDFVGACELPVAGMRIAWSPTLGYASPAPEVVEITTRAAEQFEALGCRVDLVEKVLDDPIELWMAEFYAGVGTRLQGTLRDHREMIDPAVVDALQSALDQRIEDYYAKVFRRYELREQLRRFFADYDLLLTPTTPVPAFPVEHSFPPDLADKNIVSWVSYTYPFNLVGLPAASVPCGFTADGLPLGLQLVGRVNREVDVLRAAAAFERAAPWAHRTPPLPQMPSAVVTGAAS